MSRDQKGLTHLVWVLVCLLVSDQIFLQMVYSEYQAKGKRDPFVPLLTSEGQRIRPPGVDAEEMLIGPRGMTLQGIVFAPGGESYALINGQVVRHGDVINKVKILKIEPTVVTILVAGQSYQMTLHAEGEDEADKSEGKISQDE